MGEEVKKEKENETKKDEVKTAQDEQKDKENQDVEQDDASWDEKTKKYIGELRKESAKYRTKAKDLEGKYGELNDKFSKFENGLKTMLGQETDKKLTPEEQVEALQSKLHSQSIESAIKDIAIESGIKGENQFNYLQFLFAQRMSELDEGEEITEDDVTKLVGQVNEVFGKRTTSTSVTQDGKNPDIKTDVTPEQFAKMTTSEKSVLYGKDKNLYNSLFQMAKDKRLI